MARRNTRRTTTDGALGLLNSLSSSGSRRRSRKRRHTDIYDIPPTPEPNRRTTRSSGQTHDQNEEASAEEPQEFESPLSRSPQGDDGTRSPRLSHPRQSEIEKDEQDETEQTEQDEQDEPQAHQRAESNLVNNLPLRAGNSTDTSAGVHEEELREDSQEPPLASTSFPATSDEPNAGPVESNVQVVITPSNPSEAIREAEAEAEADRQLHAWLFAEKKKLKSEKLWEILLSMKLELKSHAAGTTPVYLDPACEMVRELQIRCLQNSDESGQLDFKTQNLMESILPEIKQVLHAAAYTTKDAQTKRKTVSQVERHLVPEMITLVMLCFRVYRTSDRAGSDFLRKALTLLLKCVNQIEALQGLGYVKSGPKEPKAASLCLPLTRLLKAMELGELDEGLDPQLAPETDLDIASTQMAWSELEENNLVNALQRFTGKFPEARQLASVYRSSEDAESNRYILTLQTYRHCFRDRTVLDLKTKANEIRAMWMSTAPSPSELVAKSWLASV
ncbi:hypothetical protein N7492_007953 [Penicillium capsulatum]|uniref:Uncharacterized protein n=1 Tax=Penicillium capsulatum TaxID=69766 RepID=A0A9W9HRN3_9EURO|nr:hypothetical protein N7492_007953 [Penicillium capsulatum]KAJ6105360.1 hypothetical protein N7512_008877 [Penicillium capsulatum]